MPPDLEKRLEAIIDKLVPIAGELMFRACSDDFEHPEKCNCRTCRAFLGTHQCQNELEQIIKEIRGEK